MAAEPRLDPDLVALPGVQPHLDQRRLAKRLENFVFAARIGAVRIARMRPLLDLRALVPDEAVSPLARVRIRMAVDHGAVDPFRLATAELRFELLLCARILGEDDQARRVAVDPVDDERPPPAL